MDKIGDKMKEIVAHAGKHKNPWTGSGGMLLGTVEEIGPAYKGDLKVGDKICNISIPVPDTVKNRRDYRDETGNRPG